MTQFDDHFADSFDLLLEHFGESITYIKPGQPVRAINAIVDRAAGETYNASGNVVTYRIRVKVHNDATKGISSTEFDEGKDKIAVSRRSGEAKTELIIDQLLNAEGGVTVFKVA